MIGGLAGAKQVKEIMIFLHSHAISTNLAVKIYKQYGDQALAVVQDDPTGWAGHFWHWI
jgi:exodeoxyribonuclease V alpha subunit